MPLTEFIGTDHKRDFHEEMVTIIEKIVFNTMMVFGLIVTLSSIPVYLITNFILTPAVLFLLGLSFSIGTYFEYRKYKNTKKKDFS